MSFDEATTGCWVKTLNTVDLVDGKHYQQLCKVEMWKYGNLFSIYLFVVGVGLL